MARLDTGASNRNSNETKTIELPIAILGLPIVVSPPQTYAVGIPAVSVS